MKTRKIVASIEARMTSSRLPGKVLMEAINGVSMLEFMINRLNKSELIDDVIIATTINKEDDDIVMLCERLNINYFRGSEHDVLLRVLEAHKSVDSDVIVELTGDCPLIDPVVVDKIINTYLKNDFDYVSNSHLRSYPDGFDAQLFSVNLLEEISKLTTEQYDRENVSSFIYRSGKYSTFGVIAEENEFWPELRVTLDDKGDYLLIIKIIEFFYSIKKYSFTVKDVVDHIKKNPHLLSLNEDARVTISPYQQNAIKRKDV